MKQIASHISILFFTIRTAHLLCLDLEIFKEHYFHEGSCFEILLGQKTGEQLGKGGFGDVYKCHVQLSDHTKFDVAMKKVDVSQPDYEKQTLHEIEIMQKLSKMKNVFLPLYYGCIYDKTRQLYYIFMEILNHEFIYHKKFPKQNEFMESFYKSSWDEQIKVLLGIARAFKSMHDTNLGHFDIKPANIMFKEEKIAKPIDFGLAYKVRDSGNEVQGSEAIANNSENKIIGPKEHTSSSISNENEDWFIRGSFDYVDPLMLKEEYIPDLKSDVYSLGITFIESVLKVDIDLKRHPHVPDARKGWVPLLNEIESRDNEIKYRLKLKIHSIVSQSKEYLNRTDNIIKLHVYDILFNMISNDKDSRLSMHEVVQAFEDLLKKKKRNSKYLNPSLFTIDYFENHKNDFQKSVFVLKPSLPEEVYKNFEELICNNGILEFINDIEREKAEIAKHFSEDSSFDKVEDDDSDIGSKNNNLKQMNTIAFKPGLQDYTKGEVTKPGLLNTNFLSNIYAKMTNNKLII